MTRKMKLAGFAAATILLGSISLSLQGRNLSGNQIKINEKDSLAFVNADWKVTELDRHAESRTASIEMFNSTQSISIIEYAPRKHRTEIIQLDDAGTGTTSEICEENKALMGVNGSYFNVKSFYPSTYVRVGRHTFGSVENSELSRVNGVFALKDKKGRKPVITFCDSSEYEEKTGRWHSVLASGPMLVDDGEMISYDETTRFYKGRHPRTLIGYKENGNILMIVIDGRFKEGIGTTIEETAIVARLAGLYDAINLDGGGSATIWTEKEGVLNHPYDNRKFDHGGQRKVPNFIIAK